ncbi:hypothetical protein SCP_0408540 [Sparassis crispa]|uniref:Uncharacterized protein n=1 Tax=Sparassis crispa TaxID=139825 RepID=A0A401GJY5_9APHY|nr:hypothetical protein SCP_0408540 [Sparassis crispa]GBE82470.1 hypothetical protein SCP_0408540 [Sparassis crispa]
MAASEHEAHRVVPPPPAPTMTHHPSRMPSLPTPELISSIAPGAHYAGVLSSGCNDPRQHAQHRRSHNKNSMVEDPAVLGAYKEVMEDLKELFCARPSRDLFERRWRKDAVFEDPLSRCEGYGEYAPQWFAMPKVLSSSEQVSARILSAALSPNRLYYSQTQVYTVRWLGLKKTVTSIVMVELDDDFKITYLADQWNGEDLPTHWGALWLRKLNAKLTSWVVAIPK